MHNVAESIVTPAAPGGSVKRGLFDPVVQDAIEMLVRALDPVEGTESFLLLLQLLEVFVHTPQITLPEPGNIFLCIRGADQHGENRVFPRLEIDVKLRRADRCV
jgi:hypothetical protein